MTVLQAIKNTTKKLELITESAEFEAKELVMSAMKIEREQLVALISTQMPTAAYNRLCKFIKKRLSGVPLQYILGVWEFYSLPFYVGKGVLIPRADTEILVDTVLEQVKRYTSPIIYDFCSGSGAVGIALDKQLTNCRVTAVEKSKKAFKYLNKNIKLNNSRVEPVLANALEWYRPSEKADILVVNPPYIKTKDLKTLQPEVKKEPKMALDGGDDGLKFYRLFVRRGRHLLKNGGTLAFEVGIGQADAVQNLLAVTGYTNISTKNDLNGIVRVVYATHNRQKFDLPKNKKLTKKQ